MRTPGPASVHVDTLAKGRFRLRLVDQGQAYVTKAYDVTWCDLYDTCIGRIVIGDVEIAYSPPDFVIVKLKGEEWARILFKDWIRFCDAVMAESDKRHGPRTLDETIEERQEHARKMKGQ